MPVVKPKGEDKPVDKPSRKSTDLVTVTNITSRNLNFAKGTIKAGETGKVTFTEYCNHYKKLELK